MLLPLLARPLVASCPTSKLDVWVLGCGPSLATVPIPPDVFTIGVNNSYEQHWSPVYCSADMRALRRDIPRAGALLYFSSRKLKDHQKRGKKVEIVTRAERPDLRMSGAFAYWVAAHFFRPSRIFLLGFDMTDALGHFKESQFDKDRFLRFEKARRPPPRQTYQQQRDYLKMIHALHPVETYRWSRGSWTPLDC